MASITFIFNEFETKFPCQRGNSMEYLCEKFSNFIHKSMNTLYFAYNGNLINFKLTFDQIAKGEDKIKGEIKITVVSKLENYQNELDNVVVSEIDKIKAKIMYDELIVKYDFIKQIDTEENIIKKIIQLNFNELEIKNFYTNIDIIYQELEDEYGISGFVEKNVAKSKIIELNCNRDLIIEWIEDTLVNGNE